MWGFCDEQKIEILGEALQTKGDVQARAAVKAGTQKQPGPGQTDEGELLQQLPYHVFLLNGIGWVVVNDRLRWPVTLATSYTASGMSP